MLLILTSTSQIVSADKPYYWLATDGETDSQIVFVEYVDEWTVDEPNERIAEFEWFVDKGLSRGGSSNHQDKPVGGTKASLSMTGSGNHVQLNIQIYKGGEKNP
jgi:hypothetical protein